MSKADGQLSPSFIESVAGLSAGIASTVSQVPVVMPLLLTLGPVQLVAHPLDLIKTRLQGTCTERQVELARLLRKGTRLQSAIILPLLFVLPRTFSMRKDFKHCTEDAA